jgi:hypothetical protein
MACGRLPKPLPGPAVRRARPRNIGRTSPQHWPHPSHCWPRNMPPRACRGAGGGGRHALGAERVRVIRPSHTSESYVRVRMIVVSPLPRGCPHQGRAGQAESGLGGGGVEGLPVLDALDGVREFGRHRDERRHLAGTRAPSLQLTGERRRGRVACARRASTIQAREALKPCAH